MKIIKFLLMTCLVLCPLAAVETFAQKIKSAKKTKNQKIEGPARQTICDGAPLPKGYYITGQTTTVACLATNETGRALIITRIDAPSLIESKPTTEKVSLAVKKDGSKIGQSPAVASKSNAGAAATAPVTTKDTNSTCQKIGSTSIPALVQNDKKACVVSGGIVNSRATKLVKPAYPVAAKRAFGPVNVQVLIDEKGNVVSALVTNGNPLLNAAAIQAACWSTFTPVKVSGQPAKLSGTVVYVFMPDGKVF